jgi:hypothetical protein
MQDLFAYCELDDTVGLTAMAGETLADARARKNGHHALVGLLRQSAESLEASAAERAQEAGAAEAAPILGIPVDPI